MQVVETVAVARAPSEELIDMPEGLWARETSAGLDGETETDGDDTEPDEPFGGAGPAHPAVRHQDNEDAESLADTDAMEHEDNSQDAAGPQENEEAGDEEMVEAVFPTPGELQAYALGEAAGRRAEQQALEPRLRESYREGIREGERGVRQGQAALQAAANRREIDEGIARALETQGNRLLILRQPQQFTDQELREIAGKLAFSKSKLIRMAHIDFEDVLAGAISLTEGQITQFAQRPDFRKETNKDWIEAIQTFLGEVGIDNVKRALSSADVDGVSKGLRNVSSKMGAPQVQLPGTAVPQQNIEKRGVSIFGINPAVVMTTETVAGESGVNGSSTAPGEDDSSAQPTTVIDESDRDPASFTFPSYGIRNSDPSQQGTSGTGQIPLARPLTDVTGNPGRGGNVHLAADFTHFRTRGDRLKAHAPYSLRGGSSAEMRK